MLKINKLTSLYCCMLVILSFSSITSFHLEAKEVGTLMELGWADLVPSNWVPPLIQPDLSKEHEADPKSLVAALDMQEVKIPGYMLPIKLSGNLVSEFVLMPFLDHHTQVHIHHEPNQMVYVILTEPAQIANPFYPYGQPVKCTCNLQRQITGIQDTHLKQRL